MDLFSSATLFNSFVVLWQENSKVLHEQQNAFNDDFCICVSMVPFVVMNIVQLLELNI